MPQTFNQLIQTIDNFIKDNTGQEITGQILNDVLRRIAEYSDQHVIPASRIDSTIARDIEVDDDIDNAIDNLKGTGLPTNINTLTDIYNAIPTPTSLTPDQVIPPGVICMWSGTQAPIGWELCDGGTTNGLKRPDLRGKFIMGDHPTINPSSGIYSDTYNDPNFSISSPPSFNNLGDHPGEGGSGSITIGENNLPPHSHSKGSLTVGNAVYSANLTNRSAPRKETRLVHEKAALGSGVSVNDDNNTADLDHSHTLTGDTGNGNGASDPINITPPYYVLAFIMKMPS